MNRHQPCHIDLDSDSDSDSSIDTAMRCNACQEVYLPDDVGTCKKCYDGVVEANEVLMQEINVLKAEVDFLRSSSPLDHGGSSTLFTDVILVAISDVGAASVPVSAHKEILVSCSPVFKAMLELVIKEARRVVIKIFDVL
ncbi:unnamed protein product [Microthlaspi erraticum]|uniref:BTB domain-containing protein n=1 Tax=Microthlaspi erraticum TaxID=1685480 RepID=A0A6D2KLA4_9BRAS|nr:unnamed protein product [Microthlaspi erraticum]